MSLYSPELSYRILALEQPRPNRLRIDIALMRPASSEELARLAEGLSSELAQTRATVFYSLMDEPKPLVAWAVCRLEKGKPPRTDIIGLTPRDLLQAKAVRLPGKVLGDWISESNAIPRLVLVEVEGKVRMWRVHKSLYTDHQKLHQEGLSLYRPEGEPGQDAYRYRIEDGGRLLLLVADRGAIVTAYRSR